MRITQNVIHTGALASFQQNLKQIAAAQQRVSSGLRIHKASDDPPAASGTMQAASSLRALDQYRRNIQSARSRTDSEEAVLQQLSDALVRAKELAVGAANDTMDANGRRTVQAEIKQLMKFAVQLANTQVAGNYIFGGNQAEVRPVDWPDENLAPPVVTLDPMNPGNHRTEIAAGQFVQTTNNAHDLFTAGGIFQALWSLSAALDANDPSAIRTSISEIDTGFNHVQALTGDVGARANQLQVTASNLDALEINLRTFKSDLEEIDLEKAVTELVGRQTAFQAAMLATSRVMGMTLTDYLR
jgi:flagellar hook-associated protein 3 FlgL